MSELVWNVNFVGLHYCFLIGFLGLQFWLGPNIIPWPWCILRLQKTRLGESESSLLHLLVQPISSGLQAQQDPPKLSTQWLLFKTIDDVGHWWYWNSYITVVSVGEQSLYLLVFTEGIFYLLAWILNGIPFWQWDDKNLELQADMDRFVGDGSLDDNVESFLSHDDTEVKVRWWPDFWTV